MDKDAAQALVNLRGNRDFEQVTAWLGDLAVSWNEHLVMTDNPDHRAIAAGMTRAVKVLLEGVRDAPQALEQFKNAAT